MSKPDPPPETGTVRLPGFEVLDELGRGGMGIVYRARELALDRLVALKVLRADQPITTVDLKRFHREADAAARVLHPNIVLVYQAQQLRDTLVLIQEYVEGLDLGRLVAAMGPLPVTLACEYVRQTAVGLQHAHDHGLIHRDIKPTNLMVASALNPKAEPGLVKILDLGLARLHQPERRRAPVSTLTTEGAFLGTPDYVAPEQAKDPRKVDGRADLYSLGCTFYFLLTGRVPFPEAETVSEKLYHHWLQQPTALTELRSEIPTGVTEMVQRLMAKRPEDRYPTAAALAEAIQELTQPTPRRLRPPLPRVVKPTAPVDVGTMLCNCEGHLSWVPSVTFVPVGRRALSASMDHSVRLWDLVSGRELRRFARHSGAVREVCVAANGRYAVTGSEDRTVRLWDVDAGWEIRCLTGHTEGVTAVAFLDDGLQILSSSQDRTLRLWEVDDSQEVQRFIGHTGPIHDLSVTPDGRQVLSGGEDRTIRLWDIATGSELDRYGDRSRTQPGPVVTCLTATPDGAAVLAGGSDHALRLWELESGRELTRLTGHTEWVTDVALSSDGRRALSASWDKTVRLWDVSAGRELLCLSAAAGSVAFSPDGTRAVLGGLDGVVRLWALPHDG